MAQKKDIEDLSKKITEIKKKLDEKNDEIIKKIEEHKKLTDQCIGQNYLYYKAIVNQIIKVNNLTGKKLKYIKKKVKLAAGEKEANLHDSSEPLATTSTDKLLIGRIEKVLLTPPERVFHARIDTGATTSSLDAKDLETFERDGESWIRFKIKDPKDGTLYNVEKPIVRWGKILQASVEKAIKRPVIELQFQIGHIKRVEEFTLQDRSHLDYQLLIGRNILRDLMIVDVSKKFVSPIPKEFQQKNESTDK